YFLTLNDGIFAIFVAFQCYKVLSIIVDGLIGLIGLIRSRVRLRRNLLFSESTYHQTLRGISCILQTLSIFRNFNFPDFTPVAVLFMCLELVSKFLIFLVII